MPELEDLIERFGGRKSRSSTVGTAADGPPPRQPTMATKISSVPDRTPGPRQPQHSRPSVPRLPLTSRLPSRQPVDPSAQGRQTERRPTESGTVVHRPLGREPRAISSRDHGHVPASNASIFGQRTVPAEYQAPFTSKPSETSDAISSHRRIRRNTTTLLLDESDNYTPQPDTHASYRKITSESMLSDAEDFVGSVKALDKVPAACPTPFISRTKQPNVVCLQDRPEITPRTQRLLEEQLTVMARQLEMVQEAEIDRRVEQSIAAERAAAVEGRNLMSDEVHQASGEWGEVLAIKRAKLHTAFKDREKEFLEQHRQREEGLRQANSSLRSDLLEASRQASRLQADMTKKSEQIAKKEQHIVELHKRLHEEKSKVSQLTKAAVQHSNETVRLMRTVEYLKNRSKQDSRLSQAAEQRMKEMKDKVDEQFTVLTAKYETAMRRNEQETETFKNHFVTRLCDSLGVRVPANTSVSATADTGEIASLVKRQVVSRIMRKQEQALQQRVQEELDKNHAVIQATADAEVRRRLQELKATRVVKTVLPGDLVRLKAQIEAEVRERIRGEIKARLLHVDVLGLLNSPESESNPEGIAEVLFGGGLTDRSVETAEGKPQPRVSTLSAAAARRSKGDQVAARSTPSAPPAKPSILELLPPGQRVASSNLALFNHKLTVRTIRAREDTMERGRPYQTRAESGRFKTVTAIHSGGAPATQSRSRAVPQRQGLLVPLCVHNMARAKGVKRVRRRRAGKLDIVKLQELSVAGTPGFMLDEGEPAAVPSISVVETQRSVKPEAGMADDEPSRWLKAEAAPPGVIKSKGRPPGPPPRSTKWPRSKGKPPGPPPKSVKWPRSKGKAPGPPPRSKAWPKSKGVPPGKPPKSKHGKVVKKVNKYAQFGLPYVDFGPKPPSEYSPKILNWRLVGPKKVQGSMWECLLSEESKLPKATTTFDALVTKYKNAESSRPVLERRYSDGSKLQQRYIWEVNGKVPFVLSVFEVHYDLLLDHFFEDKVQAANRKAKTSRVAMEQDSSPQGVLDPGRLQTAMISFKALGLLKDSELLLEVVRDLNLEKLEGLKEGTLGAVIPLMLTTDEVEALSSAKPEQLLPIEKLLLQLAASPRFKERATVINFESRLRFYLSDLNQKIDLVEGVIRDALNSVELGFFRSLFGLFLRAGNYINHGTNKGEAFGIQISSFDTLRRYVGYDGLTSFYRYVAIEIDQQYPSSWDVLTWTQNIPKLRNYSQEDIQKSISDLIVELQGVTEEVVVNSKLHEDKFLALFGPLVEEASAVLTAAKERAANIGAKLWDLARLFDKTASGPAEGLDILMRLHGLAKDLLMARDLYRSHVMTEMKIKQLDARKKEKQRRELEDCERTDSTSDALSARAVSVSVPDSIRAQELPVDFFCLLLRFYVYTDVDLTCDPRVFEACRVRNSLALTCRAMSQIASLLPCLLYRTKVPSTSKATRLCRSVMMPGGLRLLKETRPDRLYVKGAAYFPLLTHQNNVGTVSDLSLYNPARTLVALSASWFPDRLVELTLDFHFDPRIIVLPSRLKTLRVKYHTREIPFDLRFLPPNLNALHLTLAPDCSVASGEFPPFLRRLYLTRFNSDGVFSLPDELRELHMLAAYTPMKMVRYPESLEVFSEDKLVTALDPHHTRYSFEKVLLNAVTEPLRSRSFPHSLKTIELASYDGPIPTDCFPACLRKLRLGVTRLLPGFPLPVMLRCLILENYNEPITPGVIPDSLRDLKLLKFNRKLGPAELPAELRSLHMPTHQTYLSLNYLPASLRALSVLALKPAGKFRGSKLTVRVGTCTLKLV